MTDHPTIQAALSAVMADVRAVAKGDRNQQQGFNFRGVDAVVNAVGPKLREHHVIVLPTVLDVHHANFTTAKGSQMSSVTVQVQYTFVGPAGDSLSCSVAGAAFDIGDKAVPKAMSVAYRTALLQSLCLPTDEPDPDHSTYQEQPMTLLEAKNAAMAAAGGDLGKLDEALASLNVHDKSKATIPELVRAAEALRQEVAA